MERKELAICIPTYNRASIMEETLIRSLEKYAQRDWDLYIYDSSTNNDTKVVVEKYMEKFPRLIYKRIDSYVHSNLKVYTILENFGYSKEYEYVWVCTDYITWSERILDIIKDNFKSKYDLLIVNNRDIEKIGTTEFFDYNTFFLSCAWHMTFYGATIYNAKTMLWDVPWTYLKEKYCIPERINFSHVAYCFEKICTLPQFSAKHFSLQPKDKQSSPMKRFEKRWKSDTFYIFCDCWISTIKALPECYHNKDSVIRKHGINSQLFSGENLIRLREEGLYTHDIYKKYKKEWKILTNVPKWRLKTIALFPYRWAWVLQFKDFYNTKKTEYRIVKFVSSYSQIYVYGCGLRAATYLQYLKKNNIDFKGFLVTSIREEKRTFMGKKVQTFNQDILSDPEIGLILALGKTNAQEVMNMIKETRIRTQCGIFLE